MACNTPDAGSTSSYTAQANGDIMLKLTTWSLSIALVALMLAWTQPASASGVMTAGDLQKICSGQGRDVDTPCRFYILGIFEGITIGTAIADGKVALRRPCFPDDIC